MSDGEKPVVVQPAGWLAPSGYANGVSARGRTVFIAGQVGWNPATGRFESDDIVAQVRQALENTADILEAAGATTRHVTRLTWYIIDKAEYAAARREIGVAYREVMGSHYPAMSLVVVSALLEARARVEIEATAVIPE